MEKGNSETDTTTQGCAKMKAEMGGVLLPAEKCPKLLKATEVVAWNAAFPLSLRRNLPANPSPLIPGLGFLGSSTVGK
jgi:hypothetical protein